MPSIVVAFLAVLVAAMPSPAQDTAPKGNAEPRSAIGSVADPKPASPSTPEDRRTAAGMYATLSQSLMATATAILAFIGPIILFLAEKRRLRWWFYTGLIVSVILLLASIGFGGQGIDDIAVAGSKGDWTLKDRMFQFQTYSIIVSIAIITGVVAFPGPPRRGDS